MASEILIGTSGFSFEDWRGNFYPKKIPRDKLFEYYVTQFDTVEINSTYYAIPRPTVFEGLVKRSPSYFTFVIKAHQSATHTRHQFRSETPKYLDSISPMRESGKLAGVLLQFPWAFTWSDSNLDHLKVCRDTFAEMPLFVEFRHDSWLRPDIARQLTDLNLGYVSVDEPQLPHLLPTVAMATNGTGYVRLHGRNAEKWYSSNGQERYNYLYSEAELTEWIPKVTKMSVSTNRIFIYFNNCWLGQAGKNAKALMKLLGLSPKAGGGFSDSLDL